jgi:D-alanyl-lipoteichoic acid acyltransferase DltB (MBOAT superfamily)
MLFSSPGFLFGFLPVFFALYCTARTIERKNLVLAVFSLVFYAFGEPLFIFLMMLSIAVNFRVAQKIAQCEGKDRRNLTSIAIASNLLLLGIFKYAGFIMATIGVLLHPFGVWVPVPKIALPLGISFFTFHTISYLIDIHRGKIAPERSAVNMIVYMTMFPQLVAGPIVRYKTIAAQIQSRRNTMGRMSAGARIFVIGLSQKLLLADELAHVANALFNGGGQPSGTTAWLGLGAYGLQIYFDFAGYSNMAIGLGLALGFRLPRNFDLPYRSCSVTEFWRRWHMSLSAWFRDYLYIPLGGSRRSELMTYRNLVIVFLLCGLWHGASWNFVIWGAHHGLFLVLERRWLRRILDGLPRPVTWLYAQMVVFSGWVWFRAADIHAALAVFRGLIGMNGWGPASISMHLALYPMTVATYVIAVLLALAPRRRDMLHRSPSAMPVSLSFVRARAIVMSQPAIDTLVIGALAFLSILAAGSGSYSPFLYFRF